MKTYAAHFNKALPFWSPENFSVRTLVIESQALRSNPLADPATRVNPLLLPKSPAPQDGWPVVLVLSGFTGNGPQAFNLKSFEANTPQVIDRMVSAREAPEALYVFCDATTFWGGSQFINSLGTGRYEDYILYELCPALASGEIDAEIDGGVRIAKEAARWCVTGASSGGYGALHLASRDPQRFGLVAALAPDSFFEASLLPELRSAFPVIEKFGGIEGVKGELASGRLLRRKDAHTVLNAIAMGLCYAPDGRGGVEFPIDAYSGRLNAESWRRWSAHDPVEFLAARETSVRKIKKVYLDAGLRDQFHLQYGSRQIRDLLLEMGVAVEHSEFDGTHFDLGERRPALWKWLREELSARRV